MPRDEVGLSAGWRRWIARALADGNDAREVLDALRAEGAPVRIALREIATIADALGEVLPAQRRLELVRRLVSLHAPIEIDRRPTIGAAAFRDQYFTTLRPVLLTRAFDKLRARRWTFADLRKRFGDARIRVSGGRNRDPRHYVNPEVTYRTMRFATLVDRALAKPSNDVYLVSRNRALEGALAPLLADLTPLPPFLAAPHPRGTSLWLGPAGTITPLHHDTSHIVFVQLRGRKRITLAPPWHGTLLAGRITDTFYADVPADGVSIEVGPGDALYIPIGTWHHVVSLEPSISLSFTSFRWPSVFDWYRPGAVTPPIKARSLASASSGRRAREDARRTGPSRGRARSRLLAP